MLGIRLWKLSSEALWTTSPRSHICWQACGDPSPPLLQLSSSEPRLAFARPLQPGYLCLKPVEHLQLLSSVSGTCGR